MIFGSNGIGVIVAELLVVDCDVVVVVLLVVDGKLGDVVDVVGVENMGFDKSLFGVFGVYDVGGREGDETMDVNGDWFDVGMDWDIEDLLDIFGGAVGVKFDIHALFFSELCLSCHSKKSLFFSVVVCVS